MNVVVHAPFPFDVYLNGQSEVQAEGTTPREVLKDWTARYLRDEHAFRVLNEEGQIRGFTQIYVGDKVCFCKLPGKLVDELDLPLKEGDEIFVAPAICHLLLRRILGEPIMSVLVRIPTPLQKLVGDKSEVQAEGSTLREVVQSLAGQNEEFKTRLLDDSGELRRFVNVYVNEEDVRFLQKLDTPLKDGDEVSIVPAIAGGK